MSVIATFAYVGRRRWRQLNAQAGQRAGEARLAERFAAGEIEEREYEQRLATLGGSGALGERGERRGHRRSPRGPAGLSEGH